MYIFESQGMQETATRGRGVREAKTTVCAIGIDVNKFCPSQADRFYAHEKLGIPKDKKLIFYSGHFEERKGVGVLVKATNCLVTRREDFAFVLFGNTAIQEAEYQEQLSSLGRRHVYFGGYRNDLYKIHRSCSMGVIASTGWDSFTLSSIEIQSSGLPLLLSDLPGLREAIVSNQTGIHFSPGNYSELADKIDYLLDDHSERVRLGANARSRVLQNFSQIQQVKSISDIIRKVYYKKM
jgi:glycosyltransferase involved in cell wall biosynthesis